MQVIMQLHYEGQNSDGNDVVVFNFHEGHDHTVAEVAAQVKSSLAELGTECKENNIRNLDQVDFMEDVLDNAASKLGGSWDYLYTDFGLTVEGDAIP